MNGHATDADLSHSAAETESGRAFFRCDFQVHTPRDQNWDGANAVTDSELRLYAEMLIAACRDKEFAGTAITDHHDMAFIQYVRRAAAALDAVQQGRSTLSTLGSALAIALHNW